MFWPCETRTSTCRSFATISSGLYRFLAIAVLLDVKDIPQVGPLQWGRTSLTRRQPGGICHGTGRWRLHRTPVRRFRSERNCGAELLAGAYQLPNCRDPLEVYSGPPRAMARRRALAL